MSSFICPETCCCCVLGGSFSCWMKQYDRPPVIHLCPSLSLPYSLTHIHTHTHGCLRKSCFIYETYSWESHRVLLRFQDCTHNISPVESLLFLHTLSHMHMLQGIYLPYLLFWLGRTTVVLSWPRSSSAALGELPADACWMWCFSVLCGRSSVEGVLSSECQRSRNAILCSGHTKSL